jgi:hypothetical protein
MNAGRGGGVRSRSWISVCACLALAAACGVKQGSGFDMAGTGSDNAHGGGGAMGATGTLGNGVPPGGDVGGLLGSGSGSSSSSSSGGSSGTGDAGPMLAQVTIDTCSSGAPSGLSAASAQALLAGGSAGSMRYLYPYASTVFPRGLISPTLMWDGASADYVYVHLKSKTFEYKGCLAPTATGQVQIPQDVWVAASGRAFGASDPFSMSLTTISGTTVTGPITEPLIIAPATLKGSIYYNSYTTMLGSGMGGMGMMGGAVLRIVPGQSVTLFLGQSGCTGCHAVSANGARMVAQPLGNNPLAMGGVGATYALSSTTTSNPSPLVAMAPNATFVGVYPDGSLYIGNAHPNNGLGDGLGGPRSGGPLSTGPTQSGLFETDTGNAVSNSGIPTGAMMGTFSPDGTLLTFNDLAISGDVNGNGPQGLATMTFDKNSRTASNYKQVFQVGSATSYPGWPFFLPDNGAIVFAVGSQSDYSGNGAGLGVGMLLGIAGAPTSDLFILDLSSGTSTILAQAMGFATPQDATSGNTYLPFGASEETQHNYYPTVSPVAAGGYFWIFFDSYRHYGNTGLQRQLWGAAIDVSTGAKYASDPSHPAFYVTGQELGTGNHRAFTALDPCRADGDSCTTGVDCCNGFCTNGKCGVPPTPRCSNIDEKCGPGHDCCDPQAKCINGYCAIPPVQVAK